MDTMINITTNHSFYRGRVSATILFHALLKKAAEMYEKKEGKESK
jgi:hypothetical protein